MENVEKIIGNLIDKSTTSIISSIDSEGYPNTKAMLKFRERDGLKYFYFTTNTSSMRVAQYLENNKSCIYFYDSSFFKGVMLKGRMEVLQDPDNKKRIWQEGDDLFYPLGVTDPDYCVLKFTTITGRYYSNFNSENFNIE